MGNKQKSLEERRSKIREKLNLEYEENDDIYTDIKSAHNMEVEDFIDALCDNQKFKETFLIPHYKMYNLLQRINIKVNELRERNLTEEEVKEALDEFEQIKLELSESKIELYFCNAVGGNPKCLKCLANMFMTYGLVHTGLLFDDVVIQWGRGLLGKSLINPSKSAKYNDYIYAIELDNKKIWDLIIETYNNIEDYITNKKDYNEMGTLKAFEIANEQLDIVAEQVVYYNVNKTYSLVFENCQHFVKSILKKINLNINKEGEVGRVLNIVEDKCDNIDFIYKDKTFNTRRDLDEYVLDCNFHQLPNDERKVLFCYRNVFEYYQRNNENSEKYKTSEEARIFWNSLSKREKFDN